ncbi:MAG TPA: signal recognition particle protein [Gemmataceae bacterium]|nr:signal recognition particle protein [Gemmataceae bacterium]
MFEGIQRGLGEALKRLRGRGRISEANVRDAMNEVRTALLNADVNYDVANAFIQRVTQKSVGQQVLRSLDPSEQIIRIVYDELVQLMGPVDHKIAFAKNRPTVIMLCGLQGSGKTTTSGKLALYLRDKGRKPLLVAADLQRPAAVDQLHVLGEQLNVPVYSERPQLGPDGNVVKSATPIDVCRNAVAYAQKSTLDTVILDTAGRLHVAEMPMNELQQIDRVVRPDEVFFVCDAMTGQDAVNSAKSFNDALTLNGVIMTKLDGDARGGAALSVKEVTQVPIKFIGVGEKLERLEEFHPERLAQRILGQGDLMSVIEKVARVQQQISQEDLIKQQKKMEQGDFNLDDFRKQLDTLKSMGSMKDLLGAMPGMSEVLQNAEDPEEALNRFQGIIDSMTKEERRNPDMIDASRRRLIARGSGTEAHEVNAILKQFDAVQSMMRQVAKMSIIDRIKFMTGMSRAGAFNPGAMIPKTKIGTGHRKSAKERAEERKKKRKRKK